MLETNRIGPLRRGYTRCQDPPAVLWTLLVSPAVNVACSFALSKTGWSTCACSDQAAHSSTWSGMALPSAACLCVVLLAHVLVTMLCAQVSSKPLFGGLSKGPTGVFKSVLDTTRADGKHRDEIYVDVVERLSATFNAAGNLVSCQIDGAIQVWVLSGFYDGCVGGGHTYVWGEAVGRGAGLQQEQQQHLLPLPKSAGPRWLLICSRWCFTAALLNWSWGC